MKTACVLLLLAFAVAAAAHRGLLDAHAPAPGPSATGSCPPTQQPASELPELSYRNAILLQCRLLGGTSPGTGHGAMALPSLPKKHDTLKVYVWSVCSILIIADGNKCHVHHSQSPIQELSH